MTRSVALGLAGLGWVLAAAVPLMAALHHTDLAFYVAGYAALLGFLAIAVSIASRARS